jgi:translation elongation factor P/translation initiation factor 5A
MEHILGQQSCSKKKKGQHSHFKRTEMSAISDGVIRNISKTYSENINNLN